MDGYRKEFYYQIIDVKTYYDFVWVGERLEQYSTALLVPDVAWAFVPVSGKFSYTAQASPFGQEKMAQIMQFLASGARDTSWLIERNIDIVYSQFPLHNPDLIEIRDNVYILRKGGR